VVSGLSGKARRNARRASDPESGSGGQQVLGHRLGEVGLGALGHGERGERHISIGELLGDRRKRMKRH
jgi:hypothetical protein